jgi:hypothetical protein
MKKNISVVNTKAFLETIVKNYNERNYAWAIEVQGNIQGIVDCTAARQKYHIVCSINFHIRRNKSIWKFVIAAEKIKNQT